MSEPDIIDISHYQASPNWETLKLSGVIGVIMKATEGTGYVDPTFAQRYDEAIVAGLAVATYHFLKAGNIQQQMNNYLNTVNPRPGERMCIDHEDKASLAELEQAVSYLLTDSRNLQIAIYSGHLIKDQIGNGRSDILAQNTSLWIAQYTSAAAPSWPKGTWPNWTLWQYTDKASVTGISGAVDGNRFNGSDDNALLWFGPAAVPAPGPEPEPSEMVVSVSAPFGIPVKVFINGEQVV